MLHLKDKPTGIDISIQRFQSFLHKKLSAKWGDFECYGRAYRNQKGNGYIPEIYDGGNYKEVFFDDKISALSFFNVSDVQKELMSQREADVSLIFCVNIQKLKPNIKHRADEEVRLDVIEICELNQFTFDMISVVTGIKSVFNEFDINQIKYRDLHPLHCFRINFKLKYQKC